MRRVVITLVLAGLAVSAFSQTQSQYEPLSVTTASAVGITDAILNPPGDLENTRCQAVVETAAIRYRWDGTDPTTSVGTPANVTDTVEINGHARATVIRFIAETTNGTVHITCWR